jgi:hypothetical protein
VSGWPLRRRAARRPGVGPPAISRSLDATAWQRVREPRRRNFGLTRLSGPGLGRSGLRGDRFSGGASWRSEDSGRSGGVKQGRSCAATRQPPAHGSKGRVWVEKTSRRALGERPYSVLPGRHSTSARHPPRPKKREAPQGATGKQSMSTTRTGIGRGNGEARAEICRADSFAQGPRPPSSRAVPPPRAGEGLALLSASLRPSSRHQHRSPTGAQMEGAILPRNGGGGPPEAVVGSLSEDPTDRKRRAVLRFRRG